MRFTSVLLTLATFGSALAAASETGPHNNKLAARHEDFHEEISKRWDDGGSVWASGTCDHDNDCPRVCRDEFGKDAFADEGTKCCSGYCACSGGCKGKGGKNECDATNDCPRVCRERYGIETDSKNSKCCSSTCNCYGNYCEKDNGFPGGW